MDIGYLILKSEDIERKRGFKINQVWSSFSVKLDIGKVRGAGKYYFLFPSYVLQIPYKIEVLILDKNTLP